MICSSPAFLLWYDDVSSRAELHLLERIGQIAVGHSFLSAPRGAQGRLVYKIGQIGASHAGGGSSQPVKVYIRRKRDFSRVNAQDISAALVIGGMNHDRSVKTSRPE
jgi:hypothetical protein